MATKNGCRTCITCGEAKPVADFYRYFYTTRQGKRSKRSESRCKLCARSRRRERYELYKDYERKKQREYKTKNRDRLNRALVEYRSQNADLIKAQRRASEAKRRSSAGAASSKTIKRVLDEARVLGGYLDAYSGEVIQDPTIDHIEPLSSGGKHDYENLCVTSKANNSSKHNRPLLVWMAIR
jgi:hypothetical protein